MVVTNRVLLIYFSLFGSLWLFPYFKRGAKDKVIDSKGVSLRAADLCRGRSAEEIRTVSSRQGTQDLPLRPQPWIAHLLLPAQPGEHRVGPLEEEPVPELRVQAWMVVEAGGGALAPGFEEDQGGGHRDVQGDAHAHHGDDHQGVRHLHRLSRDAGLLLAQEDGGGEGVVHLPVID